MTFLARMYRAGVAKSRRVPLLVGILGVVFLLSANVIAVLAFNQQVEIDGVRIETDRTVYRVGEIVKIRIYCVNTLDGNTSACVDSFHLGIISAIGPVEKANRVYDYLSPTCSTLSPGSEKLAGDYEWRALLPGPFIIEVLLTTTLPPPESSFSGRTNFLVAGWR